MNKKRHILFGFLILVLIISLAMIFFHRGQVIKGKEMQIGTLKNGVYYYQSGSDYYMWTEKGGIEKIQASAKQKSVSLPHQGVIYLEDNGTEKGDLYFRPEGEIDGGQTEEPILLIADTDMEYLIFDENNSDYLIGWTSKYKGEKVRTAVIWKLLFDEEQGTFTGVELIDKLQ